MKPLINVTPLIDVLLVLLIIFMVVTPLKPGVIEARIPSGAPEDGKNQPTETLLVRINPDSTISLLGEVNSENFVNAKAVAARVKEIFDGKTALNPPGRSFEKTVFIRAPKQFDFGKVISVIDALKDAGAQPLGLEIDAPAQ